MKPFIVLTALLVATCSASLHGAISTQYQHLDPHSHTYSYGYADPNSQKHETRSHDGVTRGSYSYVDAYGKIQSLHYTADPHLGFNAIGTNLPKGPEAPAAHYAPTHAYVPYHHHAAIAYPVHLTPHGVPVDTPEVQHAKAEHAAAHAAAAAAAAHGSGHHLYKRSLWSGGWAHAAPAAPIALTHAGVPVDTPDVQAAKAEHFAAHAKALGQYGHGASLTAHAGHSSAAAIHGYHIPVIHNGVPVETPEVQHAKAAHYAALSEASARAAHSGPGDDGHYDGRWEHQENHGASWAPHKGPIHIPVIHNGVPVEPAEVQHARAAHLNALAAASHNAAHSGHYGGHHEDDGQYHPRYDHY